MTHHKLFKAMVYVEDKGGKFIIYKEFSSVGTSCFDEALDEIKKLADRGTRAYLASFDSGSGFYPHAYNVINV